MMMKHSRLVIALVAYPIWAALTLFSMYWLNSQQHSLLESVTQGIGWNFILAITFLFLLIRFYRWNDLALAPPKSAKSLFLLWFPLLYIVLFLSIAMKMGIALHLEQIFFIGINVIFVGFSEELMFRGILFRALLSRLPMWRSIILTSILFGGIHIFNGFITGEFFQSGVQAFAATLSGFIFMALLLRTESLFVPIIYHALFDFSTFLLSASSQNSSPEAPLATWISVVIPIVLVLPNFFYALFLLRHIKKS